MLRADERLLELLKVTADLEIELGRWVLGCQRCNRRSTGSLTSGFGRDTGRTRSRHREIIRRL
jgi:hypothetical protein